MKRFDASTIAFLRDLDANNNRAWFNENKARYESDVLDPALHFIADLSEPMRKLAPHFNVTPTRVGGSLMRVYRDTRFARDKRPYKTNIGIQLRHEQARDVHAPGFYLHIDPNEVFVGAGMWRPESGALRSIRERIAARPAEWRRLISDSRFRRNFRLGGDALTRAPRGFDPAHVEIEDIKRTSFIAVREFDLGAPLSPRFKQRVLSTFDAATPFMRFLCKANGVPF